MLFENPSEDGILFPMKTTFEQFSPDQYALLRRTITSSLSDDEHALFVEVKI